MTLTNDIMERSVVASGWTLTSGQLEQVPGYLASHSRSFQVTCSHSSDTFWNRGFYHFYFFGICQNDSTTDIRDNSVDDLGKILASDHVE